MKTLAGKMAFRFTLIFLVVFGGFLALIYQLWANTLIKALDRDLSSAHADLVAKIRAQGDPFDAESLKRTAFRDQIGFRLEWAGHDRVIELAVPQLNQALPADIFTAPHSSGSLTTSAGLSQKVRCYFGGSEGETYRLVVAKAWSAVTDPLHPMKHLLITTGPLLLLLVLFVTWFNARGLTRPLVALTQHVQEISPDNLKKELPALHTRDEIDRLAQAFEQMCQRLQTSLDVFRHFSYHASHQLKTPLTRISSDMQVILSGSSDEATIRACLERSLEEMDDLASLVHKLLRLAQMEGSWENYGFEGFDLKQVFQEVSAIAEPLAGSERFHVWIPAEIIQIRVMGEAKLVQQLLWNCLENALAYADENAPIWMGATLEAKRVYVWLANGGTPPVKEVLAQMGRPFFRSVASDKPGHGLGLALCRQIANLHQSDLLLKDWHHPSQRPHFLESTGLPSGFCISLHLKAV